MLGVLMWGREGGLQVTTSEFRERYHALVRHDVIPLMPKVGGTLLDVGGGVGATAAYVKEQGFVGRAGVVDLVADHSTNIKLDFRKAGDLEEPEFLDSVVAEQGPFSIILCLDILEHLVDPWSVVSRLHSGLAPGGFIVASIPNIRNYKAILPLVFRNKWTLEDAGILDRTHLRFFVRSTAIELMTSSGLKIEEIIPAPSGGRKVKIFRKMTLGMLDSFTDSQYLIRVKK